MKRKEEAEHENSERWLLTYSDLITLLMIFFVVMYAMSNVDTAKFKALSESMNMAMGGGSFASTSKSVLGTGAGDQPSGGATTKQMEEAIKAAAEKAKAAGKKTGGGQTEKDKLSKLKGDIDKYLKSAGLAKDVYTQINERGLGVSFKNAVLFDSGKADMKAAFKNQMIVIGKMLNKYDNYIRVEGHTDNVPISNSNFRSNWELSCVRATTVSQLLITYSKIAPGRVAAVGYGEYRPLVANTTVANKSKNRRVDILIIDNKYKGVEKVSN